VSASQDAQDWAAIVAKLGEKRGLKYEPVGGINPKGAPPAPCPGGTNRLTGQLTEGFWGASCDAAEHEEGGFGRKAILPGAVLVKAYMPDLAKVVPIFNVESLDNNAEDRLLDSHSHRRVDFESTEFNKRFIATVPADHDPIALRELFSPAFLVWTTSFDRPVEFGITESQLFFLWTLRERAEEELKAALKGAGGIFQKIQREMDEDGIHTYQPGPWNAGLEPFPSA
jgi:hypothetical protein